MSNSVRPHRWQPTRLPHSGILQARTLEWVAISFSKWRWKVKVKSLSSFWLLVTPWTAAYQALPSMGFSRQEYWSGVPLPSPKNGPINDLYLSAKTIKFMEEPWVNLHYHGPKAGAPIEKTDQPDFIKIKNFLHKRTLQETERQYIKREKISANHIPGKCLEH